jgi:hypothetical protein
VKFTRRRKLPPDQCVSSVSFAGGTPYFALVRTKRKQRSTMSETHTHPSIREINVRIQSYKVLANHSGIALPHAVPFPRLWLKSGDLANANDLMDYYLMRQSPISLAAT